MLAELWASGFRGIILDLDNTLLPYGKSEMLAENIAWVAQAKQLGFKLVLLSNNFPARVGAIAAKLDVPAIASALKPLPFAFVRALRVLQLPRKRVIVIGDQLMTDILGGGTVGLRGILTEPIVDRDFPLTRVLRRVERLLLNSTKGRYHR